MFSTLNSLSFLLLLGRVGALLTWYRMAYWEYEKFF